MDKFKGFNKDIDHAVPVPEAFFTELLPVIDHAGELRVILYTFWRINTQVKEPRYLRFTDYLKDERLMAAFGQSNAAREKNLADALERACGRGVLLDASLENESYYFLNSPRGKAARDGLAGGAWQPGANDHVSVRLQPERPNIYALYEQNIGPLTPILAETLEDAEKTYPQEWIEDAIRIAVTRNARNWRFVDAILRSWKEKGRDAADRRTSQEDRKRDSEGKYADFIKH